MNAKDLLSLDDQLSLVSHSNEGLVVEKICDDSNFSKNGLLFVHTSKFLKSIIENNELVKLAGDMTLVLEASLKDRFKEDEKKFVESFGAVLESSKFPLTLSRVSKFFHSREFKTEENLVDGRQLGNSDIHPTAWIAQGVFIGENVSIGENVKIHPGCVVLSHCSIGDNTVLYPNVTLYSKTKIGVGSRIHAGAVIGSDGYGYNYLDGVHHKVWHMGGVEIGNDVEIGPCCMIDMGTFSPTSIGDGSKLDNGVHVAHNCKIGKGVLLCGQVGFGGSVTIGDYTVMGGKSGVAPSCVVGPATQIGGGALLTNSWEEGNLSLGGHPARPLKEWLKGISYLRKMSLKK